jgi:hypothetical protein
LRVTLKKSTHPKTRDLSALRAGIFLCVTMSLGLGPVFYAFHIAFASHRHRYCIEHNQFEDIDDKTDLVELEGSSDRGSLTVDKGVKSERAVHIACSILNSYLSHDKLLCERYSSSTSYDGNASMLRGIAKGFVPYLKLFFVAPKNSPPSIVC